MEISLSIYLSLNALRPTKGTGHYTTLIWADTDEVGCGMVYYRSNWSICLGRHQEDKYFETLVVCDYAMAGNFLSKN